MKAATCSWRAYAEVTSNRSWQGKESPGDINSWATNTIPVTQDTVQYACGISLYYVTYPRNDMQVLFLPVQSKLLDICDVNTFLTFL